jgi:methionyl-tRNA formyltransferase
LYELVDMGCDFVLFGGYYHVIPVIDELRIVNTHPAVLPLGRGAWPMPLTILKGLSESGITMHRMVQALDEGDIILQEKVPVYPDDNLVTLTERQWSVIPKMVQTLVSDFDNLWNNATPQTGHAEYWEMPTENDFTITDEYTFEQADLILRAFYSYECYYIDTKNQKKYELIGATCHRNSETVSDDNMLVLPIKDGFVTSPRHRVIT